MITHQEVARLFSLKEKGQGYSMSTDGEIVYSFNSSHPIAIHLPDGTILVNNNYGGRASNAHLWHVLAWIRNATKIYCNQEELQEYIRTRPSVILLKRRIPPRTIGEAMDDIASIAYERRGGPFMRERIRTFVEDELVSSTMRRNLREGKPVASLLMQCRSPEVFKEVFKHAYNEGDEAASCIVNSLQYSLISDKDFLRASKLVGDSNNSEFIGIARCQRPFLVLWVYIITLHNGERKYKVKEMDKGYPTYSCASIVNMMKNPGFICSMSKQQLKEITASAVMEEL